MKGEKTHTQYAMFKEVKMEATEISICAAVSQFLQSQNEQNFY